MKLVHCKKEAFDIYIGRKNGKLEQSKWANPYVIGIHGTRHELNGKTLGCWCAPLSCHGEVLVELFNRHVQTKEGVLVSQDVFCNVCASPVIFE